MKKRDPQAMDFRDDAHFSELSRRRFLKISGGGIIVLLSLRDPEFLEAQGRRGQPLPEDFNAFLRIGEDGRVTCFTGKIEMGQGIVTSLAMMMADELDVPLDSVDMVMGDTDLCPYDQGTWGSMSTRFFGPPLRAAAAEARAVLIDLASERLKLPASQLGTEAGTVFDKSDPSRKVSYADLTAGKRIERHLTAKPPLEKPADFKLMGKPELRRDAVAKVTGQAKYAGDLREPGMLYARLLRPPAHGAKFLSADVSAAKAAAGVAVVQEGDLVAVLHPDPEQAEKALSLVKARWDVPPSTVDDKTIFAHLLKVAPPGEVASHAGDLAAGEKASKTVVDETYYDGYVAHAAMEPHTALAKIEGGKVTIWASTQSPFGIRDEVASALGLPTGSVRVLTPWVGGGFGGKGSDGQAVEAARLAKLCGKPVMVAWTRAEEFFYDQFRPAAIVKIKAGVDAAGRIAFWDYGVYFAGERGAVQYYDVPNIRTTVFSGGWGGVPGAHPFGTGPWRAPGNNTNTFARESHIDALAAAAGMDPLEFRLKNLKDEKMIRVLREAARAFGWTPAKAPSGRGFGVATGIDAGTYDAHMAEFEVDKATGEVRVKRVVCAQDMGLAINPEGARIQMEGCITMGLGYALKEHIRFKGGEILDKNFDTYEIPRFSWLPKIETVLIDDKTAKPQGGGEPPIVCMGAVIANAIFDAVGARVREMPMTPERIRQALKS
jgi:nicotinate dehydrogenase subunit B